jgi:hypothetical protein
MACRYCRQRDKNILGVDITVITRLFRFLKSYTCTRYSLRITSKVLMIFCIRKPLVSILLFSCLSTRGSSAFLGQTCCSSSSTLISPHINRAFFHSTAGLHKHHRSSPMRGVKKENLPSKTCVTCGRPFTWRKKWERVWDEVTTCSKSCNRKRREANRGKLSKPASDKGNNTNHEEGAASSGNEFIFE